METKTPFWVWVFCESDGTPSFARVSTAVLLGFACGWVTAYLVLSKDHSLPEFLGLAAFVTMLYGANKFTAMIKKEG